MWYTEDVDGDGIPNAWEIQYGFNPDGAADGDLDADGDGSPTNLVPLAGGIPSTPTTNIFVLPPSPPSGFYRVEVE